MGKINKDFDGLTWEWRGKYIEDLKPICPDCKYELDITERPPDIPLDMSSITFYHSPMYSCPKCSFSKNTTLHGVKSHDDLLKAARKEFAHRQRLEASGNTKD